MDNKEEEVVMKISRLLDVDLREIWPHEEYDFSQWLVKEENIELLNEKLGLILTDIETEVAVGSYRCDVVAMDEISDMKVIIENQLEKTDHDHLGKLITYASGLDADIVIWLVKEASEEHQSAIEWLNNHLTTEISFFLIEIRAYRIDDSLPAPKFEIVQQPNKFTKISRIQVSNRDFNKSQSKRFEFWTLFNKVIESKGKPFNTRKPSADNWYNISIGQGGVGVQITLINSKGKIGVGLYISDDKKLFDELLSVQDEIHQSLGYSLEWNRLNNNKASRIDYYIDGLDFNDESNYDELMNETITKAIEIGDVMKKYIGKYNIT